MRLRRFLSAILISVLALLMAGALFACNKEDDSSDRERQARDNSVQAVKTSFLTSIDENWDNPDLKTTANAGEYIVTAGWADLVCEVLSTSTLQTAKLRALADTMRSEDGKKLLSDFSQNAGLIIPLLKDVGFTPTDISYLVYDLMCALISKGENAVKSMKTQMNELKQASGTSLAAINNINAHLVNLAVAEETLKLSSAEREAFLDAFAAAKAPLGELASFAYNMSVDALSDNIFGALVGESGALSEISQDEVSALLGALLSNVTALKNALGANEIAKLNNALNLVINKFDTDAVSSMLFSQIVRYAKYAYMVVDIIPSVCDLISATDSLVEGGDFASKILALASSDDGGDLAEQINTGIVLANVLKAIMQKFDKNDICAIVDKIIVQSSNDYQKAVPMMVLDIALNLSSMLGERENVQEGIYSRHPEIISTNELSKMLATVLFLNANFDKFKQTYYEYTIGKATLSQLTVAATMCSFGNFNISNPYSPSENTEQWFNYYKTQGLYMINSQMSEFAGVVGQDLKMFVKDIYDGEKSVINDIAGWDFVGSTTSEEVLNQKLALLKNCDFMGIVVLFAL